MKTMPDDCTEEMHNRAHGVAPGYEDFADAFEEGEYDAFARIARILARPYRQFGDTALAEEMVAGLLEDADALTSICVALGCKGAYDTALADAWREDQDSREG